MNIILSDVSRYKGSKGTWKDVFKYYIVFVGICLVVSVILDKLRTFIRC